jgi:benzoyl-CoA reductase/2-hydroxyglutaryl-CoA dehydratase subunit BcrC/BadD/HgdB
MTAGATVRAGIFDRIIGLLGVIDRMRGVPSDESVEGLFKLLPPEPRHNLAVLFEPHVREAGVAFLRMVKDWAFRARAARAEGRKVIFVPFNFPPDLVLAFDNAVPLTTEVLTTLAAVGLQGGGERYWEHLMGLGLPDHICSSNSIEIGSLLSGVDLVPDAIISAAPGGCDANSKIHELAAHRLGIPQFLLEKPVDDSPEGHALYRVAFHRLIAQLEDFLGERLDEAKLRRLLAGANRCTELYWEIFELHKARPSPVPNIFRMLLSPTRYCLWGTPPAIEALEVMTRTARRRYDAGARAPGSERARALWAYTSYYFSPSELHGWMERQGYTFLADVLDLYAPRPIDLTSRDSMVDGMIEAAWDYPMNRQMASSSMSGAWARDVLHNVRELGADCVIYCGHNACKQTWSVVSILGDELARVGVPLLVLHGDSWMKTTTPIATIQEDIDAFMRSAVIGRRAAGGRRRLRRRPPAGGSA